MWNTLYHIACTDLYTGSRRGVVVAIGAGGGKQKGGGCQAAAQHPDGGHHQATGQGGQGVPRGGDGKVSNV